MDIKSNLISDTINELIILSRKINNLEKRPVDFGTGDLLSRSEIHTIEAIGNDSGVTVNDLCKKFDITKGAVSQVVSKLTVKGYVNKDTNVNNTKEKHLSLTDKGWEAFLSHEKFHREIDSKLLECIGMTEKEILMFRSFIRKISNHLDIHIKNR